MDIKIKVMWHNICHSIIPRVTLVYDAEFLFTVDDPHSLRLSCLLVIHPLT